MNDIFFFRKTSIYLEGIFSYICIKVKPMKKNKNLPIKLILNIQNTTYDINNEKNIRVLKSKIVV